MKENFPTFYDYIYWRGDCSFDELPFCEVDAAIYSFLTYISFDDFIPAQFDNKVTLKEVADKFFARPKISWQTTAGVPINDYMLRLLQMCGESRRFGETYLCGYSNIHNKEDVIQFGAFCVLLNNKKKNLLIVYEGTDESIVGWHEDFTLCYKYPWASEPLSAEYLNQVYKNFKRGGKHIVIGHSKGGTNAVYAVLKASSSHQKKISAIYNLDGPGFPKEVLESKEYEKISDKLLNYYPGLSVIGQAFLHKGKDKIVCSNEIGIMQHEPYSWKVQGSHFVYLKDFSSDGKFLAKSMNQWIEDNSLEVKKIFVESLFSVVNSAGVDSNYEFEQNKVVSSAKMISAFAQLDAEQKKIIQNNIHSVLKICKDNFPMLEIFPFKNK